MNGYIPQATLDKLSTSHPEGTRHQAKIEIALPLLGNGLPASAVVATLREKFPSATQHEIESVVGWCESKSPTPSGYGPRGPVEQFKTRSTPKNGHAPEKPVPVADLVNGSSAPEGDWISMSPVAIPADPKEHSALLIQTLYTEGEFMCGVKTHGVKPDGRTFPADGGWTFPRQRWIDGIARKGMPVGEAGCWWRMNPVKEKGSGKDGAHCDADVTAFRFALVEHDKLPIDTQLAVLARFMSYGLPLSAIIRTGGKSVHAWVKLDAKDAEDYAEKIDQLLSITKPLGFDHNRNPSRLARIPGVKRTLGAADDGWQRLLYLNPNPGPYDFQKFRDAFPIPGMKRGDELIDRVREWMKPRQAAFTMDILAGKTPEDGIYFRPAEVTLWTGISGHGKSSLIKQCMMELLCAKVPFFVCSLEHKAEDICEGLARACYRQQPTAAEVVKFLGAFGPMVHFLDIVGEVESTELIDKMRRCYKQTGAAHFFIDSLMRVSRLEEDYPAQTAFMNELQSFCKDTNGHVHLVSHPRKIDETQRARKMDVKGSNNIPNNADNILSIKRNVQKGEVDERGKSTAGAWDAEISVEKQRATGWQGVTRLVFDTSSRTFSRYKPVSNSTHREYHQD